MEKYLVKPRGAIYAAVALENDISEVVSYGTDFDKIEGFKRVEP